jgi:glycosyltransferase involved in cell wall biosynthesis
MSQDLFSITVAIPTYNGAQRLPKVLEALRHQRHTEGITWDVVVIDNNSSDTTDQVVRSYQENWEEPDSLTYYLEPHQGAAFARERAIKAAKGNYVAFLDDDNIPAPDWIFSIHRFSQDYPHIGAFSGQIHGDYEVEPPENFQKIAAFLAIREHGPHPFRFNPDNLNLPPSAGLVVRKQAWNDAVPSQPKLKGRLGQSMIGGEDYEVLLHLHQAGWEIWYNPQMHINHCIPRHRLEREYLLFLARGVGLATCQLRMINARPIDKPVILARTILGNGRRIVRHQWKYRKQLKHELVPAFELEFYRGSMMSPMIWVRNVWSTRFPSSERPKK